MVLKGSFSTANSTYCSPDISPRENISRYIFNKRHYNQQNVKQAAFIPPRNLALSIYRVDGLTSDQIWAIGEEYVVPKRGLPILARADLNVEDIKSSSQVSINPKPTPHPRHADIIGWPSEKSEQKLIASELALASELKVK